MTRNPLELGTPNALPIARPVSPFALNRATASRYAANLADRPSLTPRALAWAKPARTELSVTVKCLNSSSASSTLKKHFYLDLGSIDARVRTDQHDPPG
jgi:hypothetical protein